MTTLPASPGRRATRPLALLLSLALLVLAAVAAGAVPASAADGPTAAQAERIVIADVHTDAVSTFWDDGHLVLASKADTPALHTRYEAEDVWFHVDDDSRIAGFPAGYDFVAPAGTTVWLAPEVQQPDQIWPGFSTESVPPGTLDNEDVTLTLVDVDGPGDVELWQTGSFGAAQRLWSSDEAAYKSFTRKTNVHMHANWAFTAPGLYDITVKATAAVGGQPVEDTATYTFVVGELPADEGDPTVGFNFFPEEFVHGQQYTLTATHTGTVEGATYRWEMLQTGSTDWYTISNAEGPIDTETLTFTAQQSWDGFLWRVALLDADGTRIAESEPEEMRVSLPTPTEDGLHILGLAGHYHQGTAVSLTAVLVGEDDAEGTYRWSIKRADQAVYHVWDDAEGDNLTLTAEQALDGAQVKVERLVDGAVTVASDPVTVLVDDHGAPAQQVVTIAGETEYDAGDAATLTAGVTPATVLDRYQWYLRPAGAGTATPIPGATSATYAFTAAAEHDGAAISVAVVGEDGVVAYGPSSAHVLTVRAAGAGPSPVVKASPTVTVKAKKAKVKRGKKAVFVVTVTATGAKPTGKVTVRVAGRSKTVRLDGAGRAKVKIRLRAKVKAGKKAVTASYAGDARVGQGVAKTRIRVTR